MDYKNIGKSKSSGFLRISKAKLRELRGNILKSDAEVGYFISILFSACFSERHYQKYSTTVTCQRGESVFKLADWEKKFGLDRMSTKRFLNKLKKNGVIEIREAGYHINIIRVTDYDGWVCSEISAEERAAKLKAEEESLQTFLERYREVTFKPVTNIGEVRELWKSTSPDNRILALNNVLNYYCNTDKKVFVMGAAGYLKKQAYLNEFEGIYE